MWVVRRTTLRASDADREAVAERLRHACAEGRLLAEELEERLGAVFSARTYGELDALVDDLPAQRPPARSPMQLRAWALPALALAIAMAVLLVIVVLAVVFFLTGVFAIWMVWLAAGWWAYGRRRRNRAARYSRPIPPAAHWHDQARGTFPPRLWL
jgi:Flp pilus assembly protein TadB